MNIPDRWVIAHLWVIRHKPTGHLIPQPSSRYGRGGSHVEPMDPKRAIPRFFYSEHSAKAYLGQWVRGKASCRRYEDGDEIHNLEPTPHRIKSDMEIVPVVLVPKELQ